MAGTGNGDPIADAAVSPDASLTIRNILKAAIDNETANNRAPGWLLDAQALLANVLVNDVLNWWNGALPNTSVARDLLIAADTAAKAAGNSALACHARGMVLRAQRHPNDALKFFRQAKTTDDNFARGHAQFGNQKTLVGRLNEAHAPLDKAIVLNPHHPAIGYFYWGKGRAYFTDKIWSDATYFLKQSVKALPTVWYNRLYLAAAHQKHGDTDQAVLTLQQFISDPQFNYLGSGKSRVADLIPPPQGNPYNDPVIAARQNLREALIDALAHVP